MTADRKSFIVFATVRSGSYHLVDLLDSAPDIVCYGEVYKRELVELPDQLRESLGLGPRDVAGRDALGSELMRRLARQAPGSAVGFKLLPNHLRGRDFLREMLHSGDYRVVVLSRPVLEVYVSLELARATGEFVRRRGSGAGEQPQLEARAEGLTEAERLIRRFRRLGNELRAAGKVETYDIGYHDLGKLEARRALLGFLGSETAPEALSSGLVRQSSRPLHARVANWDWLVEHLSETDRLPLLEEAGYRTDGTPA